MNDHLTRINDPVLPPAERLAALRAHEAERAAAGIAAPASSGEINNHIHTIYSFSPYTPSMAALRARDSGLEAAGSVDHDSVAAAAEMVEACSVLGIGGCVGFEMRVSFKLGADGRRGPFADRKINNPDSKGLIYMTVQGVPQNALPKVRDFLRPVQKRRNERTERMVGDLNALIVPKGLRALDFGRDVLALSKAAEGGGLTERHLLSGLSASLVEKYGKSPRLVEALEKDFGVKPAAKIAALLADPANPHYAFDLLGVLKSNFLDRVFIQPDELECIPAAVVVDFARSVGAIPAYAYLGDIGESPTGDKKAEKFEDDYVEELFDELVRLGYRAVTYMPPRNTVEQLRRVQKLCAERGLMEISGVDINSSRQTFNCPEVLKGEFRHLVDTTWALIAHERLTGVDRALDLFSSDNPLAAQPLARRLRAYAAAGRALDKKRPIESAAEVAGELKNGRYSQ